MDNKDRLNKAIEEMQDKLAEGWKVDIISRGTFNNESGKPMLSYEIVLEKE